MTTPPCTPRAPSPPTPETPHPALLCERCGYTLEGLPDAAACPECGQPAAESLPQRRTGTPWQRGRSGRAWLATNWGVLRRPRSAFRSAVISRPTSLSLMHANLTAAALILAAGGCTPMLRVHAVASLLPPAWWRAPVAVAITALLIVLPVALACLWLVAWVESAAARLLCRRRAWRITPDVAWTVCAHASAGLVIGAALAAAGLLATWLLELETVRQIGPATFSIDPLRPWRLPVAGLLVGLIAFEVLVNVGLRQCRFANAPPPP